MLNETFVLWPANVENLMKNSDLAFLQSMKEDTVATFGPKDKVLDKITKRKNMRQQLEQQRANKEKMRVENEQNTGAAELKCHLSTSTNKEDSVNEYVAPKQPKRNHHRLSFTGSPAFIPHDIVKRPRLVVLATRLNMIAVPTSNLHYSCDRRSKR